MTSPTGSSLSERVHRREFPILLVTSHLTRNDVEGKILQGLIQALEEDLLKVIDVPSCKDGRVIFQSHAELSAILIDWDLEAGEKQKDEGAALRPNEFIREIRLRNSTIPIYLLTDKLSLQDVPAQVISNITGYIWKSEDVPSFIAGRIKRRVELYLKSLLPPFFSALVHYADKYNYSWHTPGHMGGIAFLKSATGRAFYDYYGPNVFRSDLSVSVPELGSLLEHSEVVGKSEAEAARVFGADRTYYVINGNSTANKVVFHSCVTAGDIVLVDRNCHKSIIHAVIMTGAIPIYLTPTRNGYGIIGPFTSAQLDAAAIEEKIEKCPLLKGRSSSLSAEGGGPKIKLAVVTNSTYDGLCYRTGTVKHKLSDIASNILFDEAWFAYGKIHPLYAARYAMSEGEHPHHHHSRKKSQAGGGGGSTSVPSTPQQRATANTAPSSSSSSSSSAPSSSLPGISSSSSSVSVSVSSPSLNPISSSHDSLTVQLDSSALTSGIAYADSLGGPSPTIVPVPLPSVSPSPHRAERSPSLSNLAARGKTHKGPKNLIAPNVFATQSTHKLLAAFSQAAMIHVKSGYKDKVNHDRFNEAFMMHTSTSPQYGIIASLDVATRMVSGPSGTAMVGDAIEEAIVFRKKMQSLQKEVAVGANWFFKVWQAPQVPKLGEDSLKPIELANLEMLKSHSHCWTLREGEIWHGFERIDKGFVMLDPLKVTMLTPGIKRDGSPEDLGIPAAIVSKFLRKQGIVVEKTGFYSFLILFSLGITKGKSGTLIAELFGFKHLYESNTPLSQVFPDLVESWGDRYRKWGLRDLCQNMHQYLHEVSLIRKSMEMYSTLPKQEMRPTDAYAALVNGRVDCVPVSQLAGRISAVLVAPYPPGIPIIMPGESFSTEDSSALLDYLRLSEKFDSLFPGFESEIHGVCKLEGSAAYHVMCVRT